MGQQTPYNKQEYHNASIEWILTLMPQAMPPILTRYFVRSVSNPKVAASSGVTTRSQGMTSIVLFIPTFRGQVGLPSHAAIGK